LRNFNEEALKIVCAKYRCEQVHWDSNICWYDSKGVLHRQINSLTGHIYYVSKEFTLQLADVEDQLRGEHLADESRKYRARLQEREEEKKLTKAEKRKNRLPPNSRVHAEYEVCINNYLTEFETSTLNGWSDRKYVSLKHLLFENEPGYIDKYTTAYNSEIVRAIMSHE
tara:strand:+ start:132 stop:638 length:507 start_codon:yes stop_codon:yes gene_type:complete